MVGEVLLPYHLCGFSGFGPERLVGFVSGSVVELLKQIRGTKGLAVKKLEGGLLSRIVDQSGTRICGAAKKRIAVIAKPQIQYEVVTKVNFVLAVNGKYG